MKLSQLIILIVISFSAASTNAESCGSWFADSGLKPGSADCEIRCATLLVDMGTFTCPLNCEKFCQRNSDPCRSPAPRQCGFYRSCVDQKFQCGPEGYPIRYGEKYCERFAALTRTDLTDQGIQWRDSTMLCLQRELSNLLYSSNSVRTCSDLTTFAFASHAACYTQKKNSICDLSTKEMAVIGSTVDVGDIMTIDGMSQIVQVLKTCIGYVESQVNELRGSSIHTARFFHRESGRGDSQELTEPQIQSKILELEEKLRYLYELK